MKLKNYIKNNIKNTGLGLATALSLQIASPIFNYGCSKEIDNELTVEDCREKLFAFDICTDVIFAPAYIPNSLPGVKDIVFKKVPNNHCGYISEQSEKIIGREEPWQVMAVIGDGTNDSLVNLTRSDISGAIILNKVWLKDSLGQDAAIVANKPYSATHIEVYLDAREIPDTSQWVIRNGKKYIPGVGGYIRNGNIEVIVNAYGETRSTQQSTYHLIKIINPTLIPYEE